MSNITLFVASINFIVSLAILILMGNIVKKLKGSKLYYTAIFFVLAGITFVIHSGVEIFQFGIAAYAFSALIVSLLFLLAIYFANESTRSVGGNYGI